MKALWDELASYHDPLACSCGGMKDLTKREENEEVMQFPMGPKESYATGVYEEDDWLGQAT
ncbi:hypothetical protein CK203_053950 [Vitis vinifera]|uniref:Uncharacterized protein n=1 Tax=Vitis vinifera TaxID=29760 RepID=A0A438D4B5_VITVI|nr:hypothetical protein CK203_094533 [Vitis vinifera]RVW80682.1 hypothetical protein CK203_053950 [Vitis vinifera]